MPPPSLPPGLRRIFEERFDLNGLSGLCFDLGIDVEQLAGPGSSKDTVVIKLCEWLERHDRLPDAIEYLQQHRTDIDLAEYGLESQQTGAPEVAIEFTNRDHERQLLTDPSSPPYVLIDAPAGYGKTRLLAEIQTWFKNQGWTCARMYFRNTAFADHKQPIVKELILQVTGHPPPDMPDLDDYLDQFALALLDARKSIILFFDSVEALDQPM